jgi:hypothetical protein
VDDWNFWRGWREGELKVNFKKRSFAMWLFVTVGACAAGVIAGVIWDYFTGGDYQIWHSIRSGIIISTVTFFMMSFPEKVQQYN